MPPGHNQGLGVDVLPPKGQAIAEVFGEIGLAARSADELDAILKESFAYTGGPCLLGVDVESIADRVPPDYSWLTRRGEDPLSLEAREVKYV